MPPKKRTAGLMESPEKRIRAAVKEFEESRRAWDRERAEIHQERVKICGERVFFKETEENIEALTKDKFTLQDEKKLLEGRVEKLELDLEKEKVENAKLEKALGKYRKIEDIMKEGPPETNKTFPLPMVDSGMQSKN